MYSARLTQSNIRAKIRQVLSLHDIPAEYKIEMLEGASTEQKFQKALKSAIQKVKQQAKRARYPIFFDIQPIVQYAFAPEADPANNIPGSRDPGHQLDRLLLQLRLTTLMRSVDVANIVWGVFEYCNQFFF